MAGSHEKDGIFWSLVSWVAAIVGALVVGWIVAAVFGEVAAGIIFGGVAFMILAWVLSRYLGPSDDAAAPHLPAAAHVGESPRPRHRRRR